MRQHHRKLIIAGSTYLGAALLLAGCGSETPPSQPSPPPSATVTPVAAPQPTTVAQPPQDNAKIYDEALSKAAAANAIRQSALSKDDWLLIADNMQSSVDLLKSIPSQSAQGLLATKILPEYQQKLAIARQKAANFVPKPAPEIVATASVDRPPAVSENSAAFSLPIVEKLNGIPVVEVNFNGNYSARMLLDTGASRTLITQTVAEELQLKILGKSQAKTANGIGTFSIAAVDSIKFGSGETRNVMVSIGADDLNYGLLGHDVYDGYDITIKESSIEFKRRS